MYGEKIRTHAVPLMNNKLLSSLHYFIEIANNIKLSHRKLLTIPDDTDISQKLLSIHQFDDFVSNYVERK